MNRLTLLATGRPPRLRRRDRPRRASSRPIGTRTATSTFVTAEDLHGWMEAGHADEVVFIDNRNLFTFEQRRIAGARLIPTDDVELSLGSLPLNKWAVFYCT